MEEKVLNEFVGRVVNAVLDKYPDYTRISMTIDSDGYASISIIKCEDNPGDDFKRKELFDSWRFDGNWRANRADEQNAYYAEHGLLMEG